MLGSECLHRVNHGFIVCRQCIVDRALQQQVAEPHKVCVHVRLARKGNFGRLLVGSLAKPDPDAVGQKLFHIRLGTIKVGLNHHANGAARFRACLQAPHNVKRHLSQVGVFHVNADKIACRFCVLCQVPGNGLGERRRKLQAHLRQLDADVGLQLAFCQQVKKPVIDVSGPVRLCLGGNAFAQRVERGSHPLAVD